MSWHAGKTPIFKHKKKPVLAWEREARLKEKRCRDCVQKGSQNHSKGEPWHPKAPKGTTRERQRDSKVTPKSFQNGAKSYPSELPCR